MQPGDDGTAGAEVAGVVTAELIGVQTPRICWVPPAVSTERGREAVELAASVGLELDPWQAFTVEHALATRPDGKFTAFEVGLCVARQNGKGSILEAVELAGLFLLGERMIIHSAHQFDTSLEAFRRLLDLVEGSDELMRQVQRVTWSHGEEGIELRDGQRIRFRTRTKGGGRGFTGDRVILDEAMVLSNAMHGALLPTMSARSIKGNPQILYTGSAVDQMIHEHGEVFARVRQRGIEGGHAGLMYVEWSAEGDILDCAQVADDREAWARANPGLGIRISEEHIGFEHASMDPRTFAVERLGIGDWPAVGDDAAVISLDVWRNLTDPASKPMDPVVFALDSTPDRRFSAITVAGKRPDGRAHLEIVEHKPGVGWLIDRTVELVARHRNDGVMVDEVGAAASLVPALRERDVNVRLVNSREHAQACGQIFDACEAGALRHLGQPAFASAIKGATQRLLGGAWAWDRKNSSIDITPLVAGTLALWGLNTATPGEAWTSSW